MPRGAIFALSLLLQLKAPIALAAPLQSGPVTVTAEGRVLLGKREIGRLPLPPPPHRLEVAKAAVAGHDLLHVKVLGNEDRRGELLVEERPAEGVIFSGLTGPQGTDGEWRLELRVDARGVLRFQRREEIARCDGAPTFLFPQLYDFAARRFRAAAPAPPAVDAPVLQATRDPSRRPASDPPLNGFRFVAASSQAGDGGQALNLAPPRTIDDGVPQTVWWEALGSDGRGVFLTARARPSPYGLAALKVIPGDARDRRRFREGNRLKQLLLVLSKDERYRVRFPRDPLVTGSADTAYWVELPRPAGTDCATVVIEEVYPGRSARGPTGGRTAIAELRFYTEVDFGEGLQRLKKDLASDRPERHRAAIDMLAHMGNFGVEAALARLPDAREPLLGRLVAIVARNHDGRVAAPLIAALERMKPPTRTLALETIGRLGDAAVTALVSKLGEAPPSLRPRLARQLGKLGGPRARRALLAAAGQGAPATRAAVVDALVELADETTRRAVTEQALSATRSDRRADLVLAAGRLGKGQPEAAATAQRLVSLLDASQPFEVRYRLIGALARLDLSGQLATLVKLSTDDDPVLRWTAVRQLGRARAIPAARALLQALQDGDPRVRASAARGLAAAKRQAAVERALASMLDRERWAFAAAAAAEALGSHCGGNAVAALRRAIRAARRHVDERALISLIACRPAKLAPALLALAASSAPKHLRRRALLEFPAALATDHTADLVGLFAELRRRALRSFVEEEVVAAAAATLARTGDPRAMRALADALALDANPAVRAAAAHGLARKCPPAHRTTVVNAARDRHPAVAQAAGLAIRRCGWK